MTAVARRVGDAAPERGDQFIDEGAARLQPGERTDLVARHQPLRPQCRRDRGEWTGTLNTARPKYSETRKQPLDPSDGRRHRPIARDPIVCFPAEQFTRQRDDRFTSTRSFPGTRQMTANGALPALPCVQANGRSPNPKPQFQLRVFRYPVGPRSLLARYRR
jgi:hypothetical protein